MNILKHNKINKPLNPELNHHRLYGRRSRALAQALPVLKKRWNSSSHKNAFTIIEVVLVLAIAGLIFLMVFIALPALQRNQRDAQRRSDLSRVLSATE
ncbi:MAG: type II secretion system protein [Candidatus Sacchiramonaceae bacterium]|nr:type II secretion system protein [Candidatus Saccharimonadaceae bacterium]